MVALSARKLKKCTKLMVSKAYPGDILFQDSDINKEIKCSMKALVMFGNCSSETVARHRTSLPKANTRKKIGSNLRKLQISLSGFSDMM